MSIASELNTYSSPKHKLIRFFKRSRDGWKQKCQTAKKKVKGLANNLSALRESRNRWKAQARQYRTEVEQLRQQLAEIKSGLS